MTLSAYPAYRPSGVLWLDDVPEHWEVTAGRSCFSTSLVLNNQLMENVVLSLSFGQVKVKNEDKLHGLVPASFETYQIIEPGDIVCRPTDLQNDWNSLRFGLSSYRGIITSAYIRLRTTNKMMRQYGYLLLHSYDLMKVFYGLGSGLRQSLRWDDFKSLPIPLPPLPEQRAIVRYLDHAGTRIRRYVYAKRSLAALLEEERRALVSRAVTRGLDPAAPLKPSGVEWLDDVPEHWEVRRLGTVATIINGATPSTNVPDYWDGDILWVTPDDLGKLNTRYITDSARRITEDGYEACGTTMAPANSIVLSTRAPIGHLGILKSEGCVNQGCRLLVPNADIPSDYLYYVLSTSRSDLASLGQGSTFTELSKTHLSDFRIPFPPLDEQRAIVAHLDAEMARIDRAVARARRQVELAQEYRDRLIADVVTGKLDVREAVARLPDADGGEEAANGGAFERAEPGAVWL